MKGAVARARGGRQSPRLDAFWGEIVEPMNARQC